MRHKKILLNLVLITLILSFAEGSCYLVLKYLDLRSRDQRNWRRSFKASELFEKDVDINALYNEQKDIYSDVEFDFYRFYRPKPDFEGKYMSTDGQGFRNTTQHLKDQKLKKKVIVFLGGSTMWGGGTASDNNTIASLFSKYFNEKDPNINYEVKNYGVGGYQNTQEIILLLQKLGREQIDYVIFYDWVNEAIMGYWELHDGNNNGDFLQPSISAGISGMVNYLSQKGLYDNTCNLKIIIKKSNIVKAILLLTNTLRKQKNPRDKATDLSDKELHQANRIIRLYKKNKKIINAVAGDFNFKPFFIMQPNLFTKKVLSKYEETSPYFEDEKSVNFQREVYALARKEFSNDENFYDISGCMGTNETIFIDDHHTNFKGNKLIAKAILKEIGPEIIE